MDQNGNRINNYIPGNFEVQEDLNVGGDLVVDGDIDLGEVDIDLLKTDIIQPLTDNGDISVNNSSAALTAKFTDNNHLEINTINTLTSGSVIIEDVDIENGIITADRTYADIIRPKTLSGDITVSDSNGALTAKFTDDNHLEIDNIQETTLNTFNVKNSAGTKIIECINIQDVRVAGEMISGSVFTNSVNTKLIKEQSGFNLEIQNSALTPVLSITNTDHIDIPKLDAGVVDTDCVQETTADSFELKNSATTTVLSVTNTDHIDIPKLDAGIIKTNTVQEVDVSTFALKNSGGFDVIQIDGSDISLLNALKTNEIQELDANTFELKSSSGQKVLGLTGSAVDIEQKLNIGSAFPATQYSLPLVDGTVGQIITTDGSGTATFETVDGVANVTQCDTLFEINYSSPLSGFTSYVTTPNDPSSFNEWGESNTSFFDGYDYVGSLATVPNTYENFAPGLDVSAGVLIPVFRSIAPFSRDYYPIQIANTATGTGAPGDAFPYISVDVPIPDKPYEDIEIDFSCVFPWNSASDYGVRVYISGLPGTPSCAGLYNTGYPALLSSWWEDQAPVTVPPALAPTIRPYIAYSFNNPTDTDPTQGYSALTKVIKIPNSIVDQYVGNTMRVTVQFKYRIIVGGYPYTGRPESELRGFAMNRLDVIGSFCSAVSPASVVPQASIDHALITNLSADSHLQYAHLIGRSSGQTITGGIASGECLNLKSTSHATPGQVVIEDELNMNGKNIINVGTLIRGPVNPLNTSPVTLKADGVISLDGNGLNIEMLGSVDMKNNIISNVDQIQINGTVGTVSLDAPEFGSGSYVFTFPDGSGTAGQILSSTGGATQWINNDVGDVVGPVSAVDNNLASFDSTTGKLIKDSGITANAGAITGVTTLDASGAATVGQLVTKNWKSDADSDLLDWVTNAQQTADGDTTSGKVLRLTGRNFDWNQDLSNFGKFRIQYATPSGVGTGIIFNKNGEALAGQGIARFCLDNNPGGGGGASLATFDLVYGTDNGVTIPNNGTSCIRPKVDANRDLGETGKRFKDAHFSGQVNSGTVVTSGVITPGGGIQMSGAPASTSDQIMFDDSLKADKIVLWKGAGGTYDYYGIGITSGTMAFNIDQFGGCYCFYHSAGGDDSAQLEDFKISGTEITAYRDFIPDTTNTLDIGTSLLEFKDAHFSGTVNANNVSTTTVNGVTPGDVVGPVSAADNEIAVYNGATGKIIKKSFIDVNTVFLRDGSVLPTADWNMFFNDLTSVGGISMAGDIQLFSTHDILGCNNIVTTTINGFTPGDVVGPGSAVDSRLASYDGVSGKLLKDSGISSAEVFLRNGTVTATGAFNLGNNDITNIKDLSATSLETDAVINSQNNMDIRVNEGTVLTISPTVATSSVAIDMNTTNKIINCADPTAAQDVATKNYVDSGVGTLEVDTADISTDLKYEQGSFQFYYDSDSTTTITTADVWVPINLGGLTTSHSIGFSVDGVTTIGEVTYTGSRTRYVHAGATISARLASGGNDQIAFSVWDTTGTPAMIPGTEIDLFLGNNANEAQSSAIHFFPALATNDKFRLYCKNVSDTDDIVVKHINVFGTATPNVIP